MGKGACRADRAGGIRVRPAKISSAVKVAGGDRCKPANLRVPFDFRALSLLRAPSLHLMFA